MVPVGHRHYQTFPFNIRATEIPTYGCGYIIKWIEAKALSKIVAYIVRCFYMKQCIVSEKITQFDNFIVVKFYHQLEIQIKFISIIDLKANGQVDSTNKAILFEIKNKLHETKGIWFKELHGYSYFLNYCYYIILTYYLYLSYVSPLPQLGLKIYLVKATGSMVVSYYTILLH